MKNIQKMHIIILNTSDDSLIVFDTVLKQLFFDKGNLNNDQNKHMFLLLGSCVIENLDYYLEINKKTGHKQVYQNAGNDIDMEDSNRIHANLYKIVSGTDTSMDLPLFENSFIQYMLNDHYDGKDLNNLIDIYVKKEYDVQKIYIYSN